MRVSPSEPPSAEVFLPVLLPSEVNPMKSCWSCAHPLAMRALSCDACHVLQPPNPGRSHFEVLEVPAAFSLAPEVLEASFKRLSRLLHPDRYAGASDRERRFSLEHATALNDAYRTLRVPMKRAEYLLGLWGRKISEEGGRKALPLEFLEEVLELQEALMDARLEGDTATLHSKLEHARGLWRQHYEAVVRLFDEGATLAPESREAVLNALEPEVMTLRYLHNLLSELGAAA